MSKQQSPSLRFNGFSGVWEEKKLENMVEFFSGLTYSPCNVVESGTLVLRSSNVHNNQIVTEDNVFVQGSAVNCQNVEVGDVVVVVRNGSRSLIGKHAIIKEKMPNTVIGAFMTGVKSNQPDFLNALLDSHKFDKEIEKNLGATINQITTGAFKKMEFSFPSFPEQTQIGHFFRYLDQLIDESRAILEKSRQLKKAMLTKMFPAHGETMPKVRFKGFEGEWNRVIVGELGEIVTGNTPTTSDKENYKEDGLLWVTPTDIKEPITIKTMKYLSEKGKKSARLLPANSILVTCIASIGKNTLIEECGSCNQQINALIPKKEFYPYFLLTLSEFWSEKMKKIAGSGTMDIINKTQFSEIETILPSLEEQTQIGNFFRQLDETIALQQAELEKLSQFKKGLLATMLV